MLTLPVYARSGVFYLHTRVAGRQIKKSLGTRDPVLAKLRALDILRAIEMTKPKITDFNFNLGTVKRFELDLSRGIAKADGPEDFERMMKALEKLSALTPPPTPSLGAQAIEAVASSSPADTGAVSQAGLRVLEVLDKMLTLRKNLTTATVTSYKNTVKEFAQFTKNPRFQDLGVSDVTRYQEYLSEKNNGLRTIDNKIGTLRALFNFAKKQGYYFRENPAQDRKLLTKKDKLKSGYAIFTSDEIKAIFASEFLKTQKTKAPDYFWVLVLALVSGCRAGEITSLTKKQITVDQDFFVLKITDSKTLAGVREVPIPIEVMKMGFEKFIENKTDNVFKYTHRPGKGAGNAVGKMFRRHLEAEKITDEKLVFHSLRKFANDFFQKSGVDFEPRCQFFGHEIDSVNINFYTKKFTPAQLFELTKSAQKELIALI